jgi:hypothetical protein
VSECLLSKPCGSFSSREGCALTTSPTCCFCVIGSPPPLCSQASHRQTLPAPRHRLPTLTASLISFRLSHPGTPFQMLDSRLRLAEAMRNITPAEFQAAQLDKSLGSEDERPKKRRKTARAASDRSRFTPEDMQTPFDSEEQIEEWFRQFPCASPLVTSLPVPIFPAGLTLPAL